MKTKNIPEPVVTIILRLRIYGKDGKYLKDFREGEREFKKGKASVKSKKKYECFQETSLKNLKTLRR